MRATDPARTPIIGYIHSIVYRPKGAPEARRGDQFLRVAVAQARLFAGHGIEGDAKAGRHPHRQLNLLSYEWLEARQQEGYQTKPGAFGEQLVIRGLAPEELPPGTLLQLGDEAEIEITQLRTGCVKVEQVQGRCMAARHGSIGVLAQVTRSGVIRVGDLVERCRRKLV